MATPRLFTLGKYEIIGLLGQGGNALVYKAYHRDIDRYLAIKVFRPERTLDPEFGARFQQEARAIARLQHPHIVPLYDFAHEDDVWYLATAYVKGGSLADAIAGGPLPLLTVDKLLHEVVAALDYAHRQGVLHRAIKPSNILLNSEGHALLADFGIFNIAGTGTVLLDTGDQLTESAQTPHDDRRSDIYALGAIAFELLTGQPPYPARTPAEALLQTDTPIPSATALQPDLPPELEAVFQRVLAKDPDDRYPSAIEFYGAFSRTFHSDDSVVRLGLGLRSGAVTAVHPEAPSANGSLPPGGTLILPTAPPLEAQPEAAAIPTAGVKPKQRGLRLALVVVGMIAALAAVLVATRSRQPPTFGTLTFNTTASAGDTALLEVEALSPLADGERYVAWLQNSADGSLAQLGALDVGDVGTGSFTYIDPDGRVLLAQFDRLVITAGADDTEFDEAQVRYSGRINPPTSQPLSEILFKSDLLPAEANTGGASYAAAERPLSSLMDGALSEATFAQLHSGLAAKAPNLGALNLHAEHTINILLGTKDDYNGNGRGENPGRKIGVGFFLDHMDTMLDRAANAPTTPPESQTELRALLTCTQNIRAWMSQVIALEGELLEAEDIAAVEPQKIESTQLTMAMLEGQDSDQDGQIELIDGECGLEQVSLLTLQVASVAIVQGDA